jgi:hypothetical protein
LPVRVVYRLKGGVLGGLCWLHSLCAAPGEEESGCEECDRWECFHL